MAVLPILTGATNPILRTKTRRVKTITKELKTLLRDMLDTVRHAEGAGLAAPQVGRSERICLALISGRMTPLINPEIIWKSTATVTMAEGCLSLPGITVNVPRAQAISVRYLDAAGKMQERRLTDFDARVVQHEVDHLEGVLMVDYQSHQMDAGQHLPPPVAADR